MGRGVEFRWSGASTIAWFAQVEAVRVATLDSIDGAAHVAAAPSAETGASWPTPS